jgi:hypothetical protein
MKRRTGEASYEVELRRSIMHMVHADRLKPCVTAKQVEMFQFGTHQRDTERNEPAPGEWNAVRILAHHFMRGRLEFLTKSDGSATREETWEHVDNFVHRFSYKIPKYCMNKGLNIDLIECLSS